MLLIYASINNLHRFACVKHSVSVHPEPGSNSSFNIFFFYFLYQIFFYTFCVFSLILIKLLAIDFFSCLSQLFVCFSYFLSHCPSTRSPSWTISILPYLISYCQLLFFFFWNFFLFFWKLKCTFKLCFVFFLSLLVHFIFFLFLILFL